jgi:hypothetical protein
MLRVSPDRRWQERRFWTNSAAHEEAEIRSDLNLRGLSHDPATRAIASVGCSSYRAYKRPWTSTPQEDVR